jgi:hypothetical protein
VQPFAVPPEPPALLLGFELPHALRMTMAPASMTASFRPNMWMRSSSSDLDAARDEPSFASLGRR